MHRQQRIVRYERVMQRCIVRAYRYGPSSGSWACIAGRFGDSCKPARSRNEPYEPHRARSTPIERLSASTLGSGLPQRGQVDSGIDPVGVSGVRTTPSDDAWRRWQSPDRRSGRTRDGPQHPQAHPAPVTATGGLVVGPTRAPDLKPYPKAFLEALYERCDVLKRTAELAQSFTQMVRDRCRPIGLTHWLEHACQEDGDRR